MFGNLRKISGRDRKCLCEEFQSCLLRSSEMEPSKLLRASHDGNVEWNTAIIAYYPLHNAEYATVILASDWLYFSRHGINVYVTEFHKRNRKRKIIWYNPPYNGNVEINVGKKFHKIIDQCFPPFNKLHKVLNRSTIKLSYSCMPNIVVIIKVKNKRKVNARNTPKKKK